MAVRVVKKAPKKRVVCDDCGATLEYLATDVKEQWVSDGEGGRELERRIKCPNCKEIVVIDDR